MSTAIQPIEGSSVHRIQSGQVIVDLCSVVKELVENSLDAGASAIDVRFKGSGLDSIEVQDNGSGISKENYASIALKHYTSKLRTFDDLANLHTFGFRGEALSSLCALSDVHVLTSTQDEAPKGSRLDFEPSGKLKAASLIATQRGTTVVVESLFKNLPVRQQDLRKNIKREYTKVINLLQAYACISTDIKFVVSNTLGKKKTQAFATHSNKTTKENITNVFGHKASAALTALDCDFEMQSHGRATSDESRSVKIHGHVSRPVVGEGRQAPDRQLFFVNSRPCKLPQIAKAINEVYKGYNLNQSPFIFCNVILDTNAYDVNVSPDKREILLHDQDALIESLKASVTELFDSHQQTVPQTRRANTKPPSSQALNMLSLAPAPTLKKAPETRPAQKSPEPPSPERRLTPGSPMLVERLSSQKSREEEAVVSPTQMVNRFLNRTGRDDPVRSPRDADHSSRSGSYAGSPRPRDAGSAPEPPAPGIQSPLPEPQISMHDFDLAEDAAEGEAESGRLTEFRDRVRAQHEATEESNDVESSEHPIPSVQSSPVHSSPGVVPNAFERMRPYRAPKQSTSGGSGMWRTTNANSVVNRGFKKQKTTHSGFSQSLRAFAAPGTQVSPQHSSASSEASDQELFVPDWPRRGPNRPLRQTQLSPTRSPGDRPPVSAEESSEDEDLVEVSQGIATHRDSIASESHHSEDPDAESEAGSDAEWIDEAAKKAKEDAKVQKLIHEAEQKAARPSRDSIARANRLLRGSSKDGTGALTLKLDTTASDITRQLHTLQRHRAEIDSRHARQGSSAVAASTAEERLSLTVSKSDFAQMHVVGQFNLGFILATRSAGKASGPGANDELFIIDQHASDEKFNFERLSATTVLQNQRLVQPHPLELTAVQRELVAQHQPALVRNGFVVSLHQAAAAADGGAASRAGDDATNHDAPDREATSEADADEDELHAGPSPRATLLSLPASREVTFSVADLEELLALLPDDAGARPAKVRRLLAMRACRSSIMIGKALTAAQMGGVVRNLGGLDKPWNCPHGRPTMRHLVGLGDWEGWKEGVHAVDWSAWMAGQREGDEGMERDEMSEGEDVVEEGV